MFILNVQGKKHELQPGIHTIGRGEDADIIVDSRAISRIHARITVHSDKIYIEDLGSKNGTFINGSKIDEKILIKPGDKIGLGRLEAELIAPQPESKSDSKSLNSKQRKLQYLRKKKAKKLISRIVIISIVAVVGLITYSLIKN